MGKLHFVVKAWSDVQTVQRCFTEPRRINRFSLCRLQKGSSEDHGIIMPDRGLNCKRPNPLAMKHNLAERIIEESAWSIATINNSGFRHDKERIAFSASR